jgi:PST family polysaccharide transporter
MRIDQVMIRALAGNAELGLYSAAVGLSSVFNAIPIILVIAAGPIAARLSVDNSLAFKKLLCSLFSVIWWSMLPIGLIVFFFSEFIISGMYGSEYISASDVLAVHIFTNLPIGLGVIQSLWIINSKKSALVIYKTCIGAAVNIGLNFLLIPIYGAIGAAFASLIAQSISAVFTNILFAPEIFKLQLKSIFFLKTKA